MNQEDLSIEIVKRIGAVDDELSDVMNHTSTESYDEAILSVEKLICEAYKLKTTLRVATRRQTLINVNGKETLVSNNVLSYEDIVFLAYPEHTNYFYTVTYYKADGEKTEGCMYPGSKPVLIKDGTSFSICDTSNA